MIAVRAALPLLALAAACGAGATPVAQVRGMPSALPSPTHRPVPPARGPHFATPEAAMRYLASAWNRGDLVELKHVTDPAARDELENMHYEATDLRLDHCTANKGRGDYECYFTHDFPVGYKSKTGHGTAEFTVGPADRPGWYMTYFIECGG